LQEIEKYKKMLFQGKKLNKAEELRPRILGFFRQRVRRVEDAEDLTQQTLIVAERQRWLRFAGAYPPEQYVFGIAHKCWLKFSARDQVQSGREIFLELPLESAPEVQQSDALVGFPSGAEEKQVLDADYVAQLLEHLRVCCSPREIHVLILHYRGKEFTEIAEVLNIASDATARSDFRRGRMKLLAYLVEYYPEMLGGENIIEKAWQSTKPTLEEQEIWARRKPVGTFRALCLRMAEELRWS
jgi:DNA-directed RNA polymerase specialized sigma24 family protein